MSHFALVPHTTTMRLRLFGAAACRAAARACGANRWNGDLPAFEPELSDADIERLASRLGRIPSADEVKIASDSYEQEIWRVLARPEWEQPEDEQMEVAS